MNTHIYTNAHTFVYAHVYIHIHIQAKEKTQKEGGRKNQNHLIPRGIEFDFKNRYIVAAYVKKRIDNSNSKHTDLILELIEELTFHVLRVVRILCRLHALLYIIYNFKKGNQPFKDREYLFTMQT